MAPVVVRPDPRSHALPLDFLDEEQKIMPPQLALPHDHVAVLALVRGGFLVIAQVEETRRIENCAHPANQVGTDAVVGRRGDPPPVFLQPGAARGPELQLRDRFQTDCAVYGPFLRNFSTGQEPFTASSGWLWYWIASPRSITTIFMRTSAWRW